MNISNKPYYKIIKFISFFFVFIFISILAYKNIQNLKFNLKKLFYNGINFFYEPETRKLSQNCKFSKNLEKKINFDQNFFFIAGHTYGKINEQDEIIYPKFYSWLDSNNKKISKGILVGDFIKNFNEKNINLFNRKISNFNLDLFFAPGNHEFNDHNKKILYKKYFGKTFYSHYDNENLFIILNPYLADWSIDDDQYAFLKKKIIKYQSDVDNIFLIFHPAIFFEKFKTQLYPNSYYGYKKTNFWNKIVPFLQSFQNNFYIISGDLGAYPNNKEFFCNKNKNILFLGTGMGGGVNDNILVFQNQNSGLVFEVIFF